jgi:hypothetical protein
VSAFEGVPVGSRCGLRAELLDEMPLSYSDWKEDPRMSNIEVTRSFVRPDVVAMAGVPPGATLRDVSDA